MKVKVENILWGDTCEPSIKLHTVLIVTVTDWWQRERERKKEGKLREREKEWWEGLIAGVTPVVRVCTMGQDQLVFRCQSKKVTKVASEKSCSFSSLSPSGHKKGQTMFEWKGNWLKVVIWEIRIEEGNEWKRKRKEGKMRKEGEGNEKGKRERMKRWRLRNIFGVCNLRGMEEKKDWEEEREKKRKMKERRKKLIQERKWMEKDTFHLSLVRPL